MPEKIKGQIYLTTSSILSFLALPPFLFGMTIYSTLHFVLWNVGYYHSQTFLIHKPLNQSICREASNANNPFCAISVSKLPTSTTRPASKT